jgi:hypothetical protein
MALLGTIAASSTGVINLDYVPEQLLIIDSATGLPDFANITSISLVQSGRQLASLTGARIAGMARLGSFLMDISALFMAESLELSKGRINGSATLTITNGAIVAVNIYGVSSGFSRDISNYVETSINANANQSFSNFDALLLSTPANIDRVNITFENGFNDDFKPEELKNLIGQMQNADGEGLLNGALVVPNVGIATAIVFVNSTGTCVVGVKRTVNID